MSKSQYVEYAKRGFWAYDVALGIFLRHLIDEAEKSDDARTEWLSTAISSWRVVACISDYGLTLGASWSETERRTFVALMEGACARLEERASIPAAEIVAWPLLNDLHIFPRGATEVFTAPVVELGRAMIALVSGRLPEAPDGEAWLYGTETGRQTLRMRPTR